MEGRQHIDSSENTRRPVSSAHRTPRALADRPEASIRLSSDHIQLLSPHTSSELRERGLLCDIPFLNLPPRFDANETYGDQPLPRAHAFYALTSQMTCSRSCSTSTGSGLRESCKSFPNSRKLYPTPFAVDTARAGVDVALALGSSPAW